MLFWTVLLWSVGSLVTIGGFVIVVSLWIGFLNSRLESNFKKGSRYPNPTHSGDRGSFSYRHPAGLAVVVTLGGTLGWTILLASFVQIIAWTYGGA